MNPCIHRAISKTKIWIDIEEVTALQTNLSVDADEVMSRGSPGRKGDIADNVTLLTGTFMAQIKLHRT